MNSPPGRKVYQRGAHIIWEVDGAKEKVSLATNHAAWVRGLREPSSIE